MSLTVGELTPSAVDAQRVARCLARIADIASETLELQEVFDRVATCVRELIPFDHMGVVRVVDGDRAVIHASTFPCGGSSLECMEPIPLTSWSPRMRPRPGPNPRIDDAWEEFDAHFPVDAKALQGGVRSGMWEPFRSRDTFRGGVWLSSYQPSAFTEEHQQVLQPIAALLGSAVEHWRIWDADRRRRERLDLLEVALRSLADTLDVTAVFETISEAVKPVLPHHLISLTELDEDTRTFRVVAYAGESDGPAPDRPIRFTEEESRRRLLDHEIVRDLKEELAPDTERNRVLLGTGMRSWLRVPVRLWEEVKGSLVILHREPGRYTMEDVEVARRFADRLAVALSHQRLAEEARVAAEARERAQRLEATVETLSRELQTRGRGRIAGVSRSWRATLRDVGRVAPSETTVLVTGESGTGKEVVSQLLHQGSPRAGRPLVAINCAALPEQLLESELFGHEKGAFTGAIATKVGKIEQASGGTLFLDEIAEMSPAVQAKLLRVLEQREFQRVGGTATLAADVRIIAATNRDLAAGIARRTFREDLYYRLNVFTIHIAPLRERPEDILPLAEVFLQDLGRTMTRPAAGISRDAREALLTYAWPGNVRELRNAIERAILLSDGGLITREHLPAPRPPAAPEDEPEAESRTGTNGNAPRPAHPAPAGGGLNLDAAERDLVVKALAQSNGNKSQAARALGLSRAQLYWRLEKHGIR